MHPNPLICEDNRCLLIADEFPETAAGHALHVKFNEAISDIAKVYPNAILVGAVAAAKYICASNEPRVTYDVDVLLEEKDFNDFLLDEIPEPTLTPLETYFENPDSANHSLKHKSTGIYIDLLSTESKPVRKKTVRYILQHREKTTNIFKTGGASIAILKPEFLIALKLNRCTKSPRSERGLCDRVDIVKLLKALGGGGTKLDHETIKAFCNRTEIKKYAAIRSDVEREAGG